MKISLPILIHLDINIPESGDGAPDLLNEIVWNLRWMLTMQDPYDGGVYNKVTNANFDGMVMPSAAVTPRYVVPKELQRHLILQLLWLRQDVFSVNSKSISRIVRFLS